MICAKCGKAFNHGPAQHKKTVPEKKQSFMFCSEECREMYR